MGQGLLQENALLVVARYRPRKRRCYRVCFGLAQEKDAQKTVGIADGVEY